MFSINGKTVFVGDFHGQWYDEAEFPLMLTAMTMNGYDFTLFNTGDTSPRGPLRRFVDRHKIPLTILPWGKECFYDWSHLMVGNFQETEKMPPLGNDDHLEVLKQLRPLCDFISIAHPYQAFAKNMDEVIDSGLVDAFELKADNDDFWVLQWYKKRLKADIPTPIVTGVDFHTTTGNRSGCVFYNDQETTNKDCPGFDSFKTLVFCEECTSEAIYGAVKNCQSVVDLNGRLTGPPELVKELEEANYYERSKESLIERESIVLSLKDNELPEEGKSIILNLKNSEKEEKLTLDPQYNSSGGPYFLTPVIIGTQCRTLKVRSAVIGELFPLVHKSPDGTWTYSVKIRITNNSMNRSASGKFSLDIPEISLKNIEFRYENLSPCTRFEQIVPLPELTDPDILKNCVLYLYPDNLPKRKIVKGLVFVGLENKAELCDETWDAVPSIRLNREEQLDPLWTGKWGGPLDCSMTAKLLWNEDALHFKFHIIDDILAASTKPKLIFMGDCIQIGLNPIDSNRVPAFSFHSFLATRGAEKEHEFVFAESYPRLSLGDIIDIPYRLPATCHRINRLSTTKTEVFLSIPWSLLAPLEPKSGMRFQLFLILWDNDGEGTKASLNWPGIKDGAWYSPGDQNWGSIELL